MRVYFLVFFIFLFVTTGFSQRKCVTVEYNQLLKDKYPAIPSISEFEKWMSSKLQRKRETEKILRKQTDTVYTIPVVVHIIHNPGDNYGFNTNISDEQVRSQIKVLNEDFRRLNSDTILTLDIFKNVAGDPGIEFKLALRDPNGNPTNGIKRKNSNIWVADLSGLDLGYSQFPQSDILYGMLSPFTAETDGVVIDYSCFGSIGDDYFYQLKSPYNYGRTTTHEIGHFLGLRHIWGDVDGCGGTDYCDDTQDQYNETHSCPNSILFSCDTVDMYQNYMDYTYDECLNIFTQDQIFRMRTVLENSPRRESLLDSHALEPFEESINLLVLSEIIEPSNMGCFGSFAPVINMHNAGMNSISRFDIEILLDEQTIITETVNISINPNESKDVDLGNITGLMEVGNGQHMIDITITNINGIEDQLKTSSLTKDFLVNDQFITIPYKEFFASGNLDDTKWVKFNHDNSAGWRIQSDENSSNVNFFMGVQSTIGNHIGNLEMLLSPRIDLSDVEEANLTFTLFSDSENNIFDNLKIYVSENCGKSFPDSIPYSIETVQDITGSLGNRVKIKAYVNLSQYTGMSDVLIAFIYTNQGLNLGLDDIEFHVTDFSKYLNLEMNTFIIHPNPALGNTFNITFNLATHQDLNTVIYDALGRIVYSENLGGVLNQSYEINLSTINENGILYIKASGENFYQTGKILISK
jgi:hypothetical protein